MLQPSVHILILNWNSFDETVECLDSLRNLTYPNYKIQLVDNASLNDEADRLKERFPEINLLKQSENIGFCGGCNAGMKEAIEDSADFVMLLNNDTLVTSNLIEKLIEGYAQLDDAGAVSPIIMKYPETDTVWFSKAEWTTDWRSGEARFRLAADESIEELQNREPYETEFACGCCLLVSADVIRSVGMLDERYFAFFDEAEWCARMARNGLRSYVIPDTHIYHKVGRTTPNLVMTYLLTRNRLLWISENLELRKRLNAYPVMLKELAWHLVNASHLIGKKKRYISRPRSRVYLLGWKDYVLGRFGKWSEKSEKILFAARNETVPTPTLYASRETKQLGLEAIHSDVSIQDEEYLRKRLEPKYGDPDYLHLSDLFLALNQLRSDENIKVLDFGCGGSPYRSLFPNADYKRADFGDLADLDYVIGMDSRLDEEDEMFDLVLSTQVAEHTLAPIMYFKECFRLLRPGGRLICTTHGTYPDHGCPYDFQRWTADGLARDLLALGFKVDRMQKLTTNVRALMYLMQKFSGWVESPSKGTDSLFRVFRSAMHRSPKMWQRVSDRAFPGNRIVEAADEGHELYLGLVAVAQRPGNSTIKDDKHR